MDASSATKGANHLKVGAALFSATCAGFDTTQPYCDAKFDAEPEPVHLPLRTEGRSGARLFFSAMHGSNLVLVDFEHGRFVWSGVAPNSDLSLLVTKSCYGRVQ